MGSSWCSSCSCPSNSSKFTATSAARRPISGLPRLPVDHVLVVLERSACVAVTQVLAQLRLLAVGLVLQLDGLGHRGSVATAPGSLAQWPPRRSRRRPG